MVTLTAEGQQHRCDAGVRMKLSGRAQVTAGVGTAVLLGGLTVMTYGIYRDDLARSLGGACLATAALTLLALAAIRRWIIDTSEERRILAAAQREAVAERARYQAAQAALENEQGRLYRDLAADRAALNAQVAAEREAMKEEFERARGEISADAMDNMMSWITGGKLRPPERPKDNLIRFPGQNQGQAEPQASRERSREHGVVGP